MKILVTGATGFLGKALCRQLALLGHDLVQLSSKNCDLTRSESLQRFGDHLFDQIYHLAAWTQAGDFCLHHPGEQWIINQQLNSNMLAWWRQEQPQATMISIGTSCAYTPDQELVEANYLSGTPIDGLFTYAMTKRMLYVGLLALHQQYGLNYLHIVPSTLYGPGYHTDGRQMHFIFDLIRKILHGKLTGERVVLWGDGYQRREVVYVDDFVRILIQLSGTCRNELINVGAGEEYTIRHFAGLICERLGYNRDAISYDTSRYVGARSKRLGVQKLRQRIPDLRLTPLDVGLAATIEWHRSQHSVYGMRPVQGVART